jgi:hypothetical protein
MQAGNPEHLGCSPLPADAGADLEFHGGSQGAGVYYQWQILSQNYCVQVLYSIG